MKLQFDPLRSQPGEFRVALSLTDLQEKAFEILKLAETLGFNSPKFVSDREGNVWAIVLEQFHRYDADPRVVVEAWDSQMHDLWKACEPNAELKMLIHHNLEAYASDVA